MSGRAKTGFLGDVKQKLRTKMVPANRPKPKPSCSNAPKAEEADSHPSLNKSAELIEPWNEQRKIIREVGAYSNSKVPSNSLSRKVTSGQ